MSQNVIKGSTKLAEAIRSRRRELGFTIEEAASKAGVGIKTWCRYEAGESIRQDKAKGICKAMNWRVIPGSLDDENNDILDLDKYREHEAWSDFICSELGEVAAISFAIGSDIVLDYLNEDLAELSNMPRGTHVGQLPVSMMKDILPVQFLMNYDYEFIYRLKVTVERLRKKANYGHTFYAHSVIQELAIFLFMEESSFVIESMESEFKKCNAKGIDTWKGWAFDLFDDMDIVTFLYSGEYLSHDNTYHFDNWTKEQFYCDL